MSYSDGGLMNTLLLVFAFPLATIILAIVLQKILKCPLLVTATFFAVLIILTYSVFGSSFLVYAIIYTILAYVTAVLTRLIHQIIKRLNRCDSQNCTNNCIENLLSLFNTRNQCDTIDQNNLANQVNCLANQICQTNNQLVAANQTSRLTQESQVNLANQVNCLANQVNQLAQSNDSCNSCRDRAGQINQGCIENQTCDNAQNRTRVTFTSNQPNPVIFLNSRGDTCRRHCQRCGRR